MPKRTCPQVPLCAYADPLIRDLKRRVPAALTQGNEKAIHEARVATRRLKAALDLLDPVIPPKLLEPLRKTLRRLRRRLGPLRDLDVMIGHLEPLARQPKHAAAAGWLSGRLVTARKGARQRAREQEPPAQWLGKLDAWEGVREWIVRRGGDVRGLMLQSLRAQFEQFARQAGRLSDHILTPKANADEVQDPHELRIAGKNLRYTFEMLAEEGYPLPAMTGRSFKRMQAELGSWHDHVVLTERAMRDSIDALLAHHDPGLQARVLATATVTLRRAEGNLQAFARLWKSNGPALAEIVASLGKEPAAKAPRKGRGRPRSRSAPVTQPSPTAPPVEPEQSETDLPTPELVEPESPAAPAPPAGESSAA